MPQQVALLGHAAVVGDDDLQQPRRQLAAYADVRVEHRLRVVVHHARLDQRHLLLEVQPLHEPGLALVQVDRLGVDQLERADRVHRADHRVLTGFDVSQVLQALSRPLTPH